MTTPMSDKIKKFFRGKNKARDFWKRHAIHHINGNSQNNNLKNLVVLTRREHSNIHLTTGVRKIKNPIIKRSVLTPAEQKIVETFFYNKGLINKNS